MMRQRYGGRLHIAIGCLAALAIAGLALFVLSLSIPLPFLW